jgi:hypothetical protein
VTSRVRSVLVIVGVLALGIVNQPSFANPRGDCGTFDTGRCGVGANHTTGEFHGVVAVGGAPWVFGLAAHSGTAPGCGDCTWTLVLSCSTDAPGSPTTDSCKTRRGSCRRRQLSYHVYLTTDAETDAVVGAVCIGGADQLVPVGDDARADVQRYLKNVTPPGLQITTKPAESTLAGLPTYFSARPPGTLRPATFGGSVVTETITMAPGKVDWRWGDTDTTGWVAAAATLTHSYFHGGSARVALTTRWGATYTITYAGQTFGPYNAVGRLTKRQQFTLPVHTASPTLVSH